MNKTIKNILCYLTFHPKADIEDLGYKIEYRKFFKWKYTVKREFRYCNNCKNQIYGGIIDE